MTIYIKQKIYKGGWSQVHPITFLIKNTPLVVLQMEQLWSMPSSMSKKFKNSQN